jgi:formylglycine-generating enzyme required for sulfatase activity
MATADFDLNSLQELMVAIPGGSIVLRDDRTKSTWKVEIYNFLLARYPVTQKLYVSVTGKTPSTFKGDQKPVETVSFIDALTFCNLLSRICGLRECYSFGAHEADIGFDAGANGFRLPSEAEWEYACRAGSTQPIYGKIDDIAWYKGNSGNQTHDVGQKEPNKWGLHDMLGNVWEWCRDVYDEKVYGTYRIFRGGGWNDTERGCLASNRRRSHPSFAIDDLGFRIAKNGIDNKFNYLPTTLITAPPRKVYYP